MLAQPVLPDNVPSPITSSEAVITPLQGADQDAEDAEKEETEEETHLPAAEQGCYSFQMSLLQRAAQTYSKRCLADKYGQVAKWLLTGLAMAISRKSWHLLSKHRTCTITPVAVLRVHFLHGYLSTEQEDAKKPYTPAWEEIVTRVICRGYNNATNKFRMDREAREEIEFYSTIDQTNPVETPPEEGRKL